MNMPTFKYHPDPIATGSIGRSDVECACCKKQRGFVYLGSVYSDEELAERICPWCIADGSAHERFDAEFTDAAGVGGYTGVKLPLDVVQEVAFKTPGFMGWQQEQWLACCNDAAAFLGRVGRFELEKQWPDAIGSIQEECGLDGAEWQQFFSALDKNGSPTGYLFQCLHCGKRCGYADCH